MSSTFCKYLTNQLRIEYGQVSPCCWFKNRVPVDNEVAVAQYRQRLVNIQTWQDTQGACSDCAERERVGLPSPRIESFTRSVFQNVTDNTIVNLEIQVDNDCNGACLICGPHNSTTWAKYESRINSIVEPAHIDTNVGEFIRQLKKSIDFTGIKSILFLGGEPLRNDFHAQILEHIINPADTIVKYTTNGSYIPTAKTIEVWSKFKEIQITISIDGIKEHFNYLRWPLQWHQVEDNIKYFLTLENVKILGFSYTTTPFSLYYHDTYVAWAHDFFKDTYLDPELLFLKPWKARSGKMLLSAVPPELATAIKEKYGLDHNITKLLEPYNSVANREFIEYVTYHDQHRNTNWQLVFPEMIKYF